MDKVNDGGPAFPASEYLNQTAGMSLRDYFAGQALVGILSCGDGLLTTNKALRDEDLAAKNAYLLADAMLQARTEREERGNQ